MSKFKHANLDPVKNLIIEKTSDGDLSDKDIDEIIEKTKSLYKETPLTRSDIVDLSATLSHNLTKTIEEKTKVPILLRIIGALTCIVWVANLPNFIDAFEFLDKIINAIGGSVTPTTIISIWVYVGLIALSLIFSVISGILMLINKRVWAGRMLYTSIACTALSLVVCVSLEGTSTSFLFGVIYMILQILISVYLQPKLYQERKFAKKIKELDTEERAESGRLGIKVDQGKGYVELDFFNLFWIFVAGCVIGLIAEYVFHIIFVWHFNPENFYDRAGLLFGPFSPIYGFGGLAMTILLNRLRKYNTFVLFILATIIGGAFEYFVSWFLEVSFGIEAWNYSAFPTSINGRTCFTFAAMFGVMGTVWMKWALPRFMKLLAKIPWKWRYPITFVATAFMIVNCIMTLQSIDCWSQRTAGKEPVTPIEQFYAKNYNDEFMSKRFASMSFQTDKSTRSDIESSSQDN